MHAAIVNAAGATPVYGEMPKPEIQSSEDEVLLQVKAAALSNLVRGQASGRHYSSTGSYPLVPGNDGVGVTKDGQRFYFLSPRKPLGSMAEYTVVSRRMTIPLPTNLEDAKAAAMGNPGIATWGALLGRAKLQPGEAVLVNGATGAAGMQAVQVAKYLGASHVIATGRNPAALEALKPLGADEVILLTSSDLVEQLRSAIAKTQVVLDYLWGPSAAAILEAAAGHGSPQGEPRLRFIQIGSISGESIPLPAHLLRSSGVEILGSGLGSLSAEGILISLRQMYAAAEKKNFEIKIEAVPLSAVEQVWTKDSGDTRVVFLPGES